MVKALTAPLLGLALLTPHAAAEDAGCITDVEYAITGSLTLSDTPMGHGDGTYAIGPGTMVVRFDHGEAKVVSYTMRESFHIHAKTVFWTTSIDTEATSTMDDPCSATGTFDGHTLHWRGPVRSYRTDGTLTCSGSFCGSFGVPPRGQSPLHVGPAPQRFNDLVFSADRRTFTMSKTPAVKTTMPKQSSAVSMVGRETRRACATSRACR